MERYYAAIDLKSFYASVECIERGLDPMDTNLVVADSSRTEKTICLAVSPSLKAYGISGRARLFEVVEQVKRTNYGRRMRLANKEFSGESIFSSELDKDASLAISYLAAPPRMALYTKYSTDIYQIYLKYVAPEDMHVYSIDEVFIDLTGYLKTYEMTPEELVQRMVSDVLKQTGITATAGIGTNLYLAKIAMDVMAKRMQPDENGFRLAFLDELSYRQELWGHTPLTDFWRIGRGTAKRLEANGMRRLGDVARRSLTQAGEDQLYQLFGVNAELLIDHAWGWEPCTIADIKAYRPTNNSLSAGQVLKEPYDTEKTRVVVQEMGEMLALDLTGKELVCDQLTLTIGYDVKNLQERQLKTAYRGEVTTDAYGRKIPKHSHGSVNLDQHTASSRLIIEAVLGLFDRIINPDLLVRRITIGANHVILEKDMRPAQVDLFAETEMLKTEQERLKKEKSIQKAMLEMKNKYGKNAVLKGIHFEKGATGRERNGQIGGHKA